MHSFCKTFFRGAALAGLVAGLLASAGTASAATSGKSTVQQAPVAKAQGEYAGQDTCLGCHEDKAAAVKDGPHARAFNPNSPAATAGCESCHGAGKAHAEAGGDKSLIKGISKLPANQSSELCTSCHDRKKHALWAGSQHDQRNVGCTSCHSVHAAKGAPQLKAKSEPELCASCHKAIVNKQSRFNHMPVRESKLGCSSCHNVHGSTNMKLLKAGTTVDESCTSCHSEKRGPYLWEHAPVADACVTCHDPHGSNNDRMLVAKAPFMCQRCHVTARHPPTVYDSYALKNSSAANRISGRSCLVCHQLIHGSNSPNGKAFLR
ncbi:MAG: DmsE family decaheme c-type cytochrome [Acidobacteriota bacterium]